MSASTSSRPRRPTAADRLLSFRWGLAALAGLLFALSWVPASQLTLDRRIEQMFPAGDPAVASYELLTQRFGGNAIVMLVYEDAELFSPAGVARAEAIGRRVKEIAGVEGVLSIAEVNQALTKIKPPRLFGPASDPPILDGSELSEAFGQLFRSYTHNRQATHGAIVAMLASQPRDAADATESVPEENTETTAEELEETAATTAAATTAQGWDARTIAELEQTAASLPDPLGPGVLVGPPVLVTTGFNLIAEDGQRLATWTLAILSVLVLLLFRSLRWVLVAVLVIAWSTVVTRGSFAALGFELTLVSSMLTAIITVIAFAAILHIAVAFRQRRRRGDAPREAAHRTLVRLLPPILWACLTDAAGFAALLASDVGPVRDFGLMMAGGALAVLAAILLLVPALLLLPPHHFPACILSLGNAAPLRTLLERNGPFHLPRLDRLVQRVLSRLTIGLLAHRRGLYAANGLLLIATLIGLGRLDIETNFLKNFRADSEIAQAYALVEDNFGGAGIWDVLLPVPAGELAPAYLASVRELEGTLQSLEIAGAPAARITKTLSMADAEAVAAGASNPLIRFASPSVRLTGMRLTIPVFVDALLTPPEASRPRWLRVMLRSPESLAAADKIALIEAVETTVAAHTTHPDWQAFFEDGAKTSRSTAGKTTGYYVLLARLVSHLIADQWLCLGIAAGCVLGVLWFAFGSLRIALIAMVPNTLPVLIVLAALGWQAIPMNMGGAMIAAVSIGLTIDSSMHFLHSFVRSRRRYGRSPRRAALQAQTRVGLAVLLTTVALVIGFSLLSTSPFLPTATFGTMLSAALLLGTAANLTLLPVMLIDLAGRSGRPLNREGPSATAGHWIASSELSADTMSGSSS